MYDPSCACRGGGAEIQYQLVKDGTDIASEVPSLLEGLRTVLPKRGRILIVPHDYPDPDALACAGAMHLLLEKFYNLNSRIVFSGIVTRAENRELLRHFRYRWSLIEDLRVPARPMPAIIVDACPGSGNIRLPKWIRPVAVFDHHPIPARQANKFRGYSDIRPELGAAATLLYQYLDEAKLEIPPWLAACMAYAVATETTDFTRAFTEEDRCAYLALIQRASLRILGAIQHAPLPRLYYAQLKEGIDHARVSGRVAWSHVSDVQQPEIIPEIADRLLRLEKISWSFCTGISSGNLILSLRSNRKEAQCGAILRRVFRQEGSAGGHHRMAAGSMDVSALPPWERESKAAQISLRLLKALDRRHSGDDLGDRPALTEVVPPIQPELTLPSDAKPASES